MPIGIARMKLSQLGATPRSTLSTSVSGENTSTAPITTSSSWVRKSTTASVTLIPVDSLAPSTLTAASSEITTAAAMMSPGLVLSASAKSNTPPM